MDIRDTLTALAVDDVIRCAQCARPLPCDNGSIWYCSALCQHDWEESDAYQLDTPPSRHRDAPSLGGPPVPAAGRRAAPGELAWPTAAPGYTPDPTDTLGTLFSSQRNESVSQDGTSTTD